MISIYATGGTRTGAHHSRPESAIRREEQPSPRHAP